AVLIPCYNEEKTIEKVIKDFYRVLPEATIYVCDNNSNDKTAELSKKNGAIVLKEPKQGKGYAFLKLLQEVNSDIYLLVDGDDTYPAEYAHKMIEALVDHKLDMVVGDRISNGTYQKENDRAFHSFGNNLVKNLINHLFNSNLNDILSGYRVFSKSFVHNYTTLVKGFELETDLTLFALNYAVGIKEIQVDYKNRPEGSYSKLNTYRDGLKIIILFFNLYRFYKPLAFFGYLSLFLLLLSLFIGAMPIYEYLQYGYVYKVPSAILAT